MDVKIINLSQNSADVVVNNGDWTTILARDLILNEGDQLTLKSAFIDTTSTSDGKILINDDLTLIMDIGVYLRNWKTADKTYDSADVKYRPDGEFYILCNDASGESGTQKITEVEARGIAGDPNFGGFMSYWEYEDPQGNKRYYQEHIPKRRGGGEPHKFYPNIIVKSDTWTDVTDKKTELKAFTYFDVTKETITPETKIFYPDIERLQINLPKGSYSPQLLTEIINRECSKATQTLINNDILDNPFLRQSQNIVASSVFIRNADADNIFTLTGPNDYLIGASQIDFNFNEETNFFSIDYLHLPMYDATSGTNIAIRYLETGDNLWFGASNVGGAFFTHLSAIDSKGNYNDFFSDVLGFDKDNLTVQFQHVEKTYNTIGTVQSCIFNLSEGLNITTGYNGLDSIIKKDPTDFDKIDSTTSIISSIQDTYSIKANKPFSDINISTSHFLVEISSTFTTNYINSTQQKNNINAIVSRYYGYSNFTASSGEGSVVYVHKGNPIYIKSLRCRILNPDLTLASIGDRNDLYLEIVQQDNKNKK